MAKLPIPSNAKRIIPPPRGSETRSMRTPEKGEGFVTVQVLAGNPVGYAGTLYYPGQQFQIRPSLVPPLVAQGRVSIVP